MTTSMQVDINEILKNFFKALKNLSIPHDSLEHFSHELVIIETTTSFVAEHQNISEILSTLSSYDFVIFEILSCESIIAIVLEELFTFTKLMSYTLALHANAKKKERTQS